MHMNACLDAIGCDCGCINSPILIVSLCCWALWDGIDSIACHCFRLVVELPWILKAYWQYKENFSELLSQLFSNNIALVCTCHSDEVGIRIDYRSAQTI